MNWAGIQFILIFVIVWLIGACVAAFIEKRYLKRKNKKTHKLREYKVRTYIKCSKCDFKEDRKQELGDYMLKEIGVHSCGGTLIIEGIYYEKKVFSKKEKKWLKFAERWK